MRGAWGTDCLPDVTPFFRLSVLTFWSGTLIESDGEYNRVARFKLNSILSSLLVLQGENGDLKNRGGSETGGLKVEINHIGNLSGGPGEKTVGGQAALEGAADFPDSSIGDGMDITIQGVNGHVKKLSHDSNLSPQKQNLDVDGSVGAEGAAEGPQDFSSDMSIGRGMDISICGDGGDTMGNKESCVAGTTNGDGDGSWKYKGVNNESSKEQVGLTD